MCPKLTSEYYGWPAPSEQPASGRSAAHTGGETLMNYGLFSKYAPLIAALPGRSPLLKSDLLTATFQLEHHPALDIYYVPFELVNAQAQVMLVGITPGWTQMEVAYRVARDGLREG